MKKIHNKKIEQRQRSKKRIRAKIVGDTKRPRLAVFKSNTHIYAQLIDDTKSVTVASASTFGMKGKTTIEKAKEVGKLIAVKALSSKIEKVVFDRGGFVYTGRIKAVADGAREGGLKF